MSRRALAAAAFAALLCQAQNVSTYEAQFNLGLTRFRMGDPGAAVEPLEKAAALQPDSFDAAYLLGAALSETGRRTDAIRRLRTARRIQPRHVGMLSLLGVLYSREGYPLDAMDALDQARRLDPSRLPVWLSLIDAAHEAFEFDQALHLARDACARFPDSADAQFRLGFELETAGKFDEAPTALVKALELRPDHPEALLALGRIDLRAGRRADAARRFEAVLRANPSNALARIELAKAFVAARQMSRAKAILLEADGVAGRNGDPAAHLLLSQIYQAEGKVAESERERSLFLSLTTEGSGGGMSGSVAARRLRRFEP